MTLNSSSNGIPIRDWAVMYYLVSNNPHAASVLCLNTGIYHNDSPLYEIRPEFKAVTGRECEKLRRQLLSKDAAARPQPLMLGQTRCSHSHKLGAQKHSGNHATVPLIKRGAERKRRKTQRHTARWLSAQMAVRTFYTRIDEQEQHRTTDRCSSPFSQSTVIH